MKREIITFGIAITAYDMPDTPEMVKMIMDALKEKFPGAPEKVVEFTSRREV